jgi:hypothetical protein
MENELAFRLLAEKAWAKVQLDRVRMSISSSSNEAAKMDTEAFKVALCEFRRADRRVKRLDKIYQPEWDAAAPKQLKLL